MFFRGIRDKLIAQIEEADYVFGCVAWLTDFGVLAALAKKRGVCIVVQKEDFLRPDGPGQGDQWRCRLREAYDKLPVLDSRWCFGQGLIAQLSVFSGGDSVSAVRCAGYDRRVGNGRFTPLMHHKFALFARFSLQGPHDPRLPERDPELGGYFTNAELSNDFFLDGLPWPNAAWTGSYNWSTNASQSLENAILLKDPESVDAYFREFQQVVAMSEPLDWTSQYVEPEWRIGT